jgi:hypothetical protein
MVFDKDGFKHYLPSSNEECNILHPILPYREYIRESGVFPPGKDGFVFEDVDGLVRLFGPKFNRDSYGTFKLIEIKFGEAFETIPYAQKMTFKTLDSALWASKRYEGYYIIWSKKGNWADITNEFKINGKLITREQLHQFLLGSFSIKPLDFY